MNAQIQKLEAQAQELLTQIEELKLHSSSPKTTQLMNPLLAGERAPDGFWAVSDAGHPEPYADIWRTPSEFVGFRTKEKAESAAKLYKQFTEVLAYLAETPVVRAEGGKRYYYLPAEHLGDKELGKQNELGDGADADMYSCGDYFLEEQKKTAELLEQLIRDMLAYRPRP